MNNQKWPENHGDPILSRSDVSVGDYWYSRPAWNQALPVSIEDGQRGFKGYLMIRFNPGVIPGLVSDVPADGQFVRRKDGKLLPGRGW